VAGFAGPALFAAEHARWFSVFIFRYVTLWRRVVVLRECEMKILFRTSIIALLFAWAAATGSAESYRGEMNGWGTAWMSQDAAFGSIWKVTVTCTANDVTSEFKFDQDGDWDPQWGTAAGYSTNAGKNATIGQSARQPGRTSSAGNLSFSTAVSGRRYTFCLKGDGSWYDRRYVVMETDNDPAGIQSVVEQHLQDPWTNAVPVQIQWSATPSTQEAVWIRWSTNGFAVSAIVRGAGQRNELHRFAAGGGLGRARGVLSADLDHAVQSDHRRCRLVHVARVQERRDQLPLSVRRGKTFGTFPPTPNPPARTCGTREPTRPATQAVIHLLRKSVRGDGQHERHGIAGRFYHRLKGAGDLEQRERFV
jgi:hypothetical protein